MACLYVLASASDPATVQVVYGTLTTAADNTRTFTAGGTSETAEAVQVTLSKTVAKSILLRGYITDDTPIPATATAQSNAPVASFSINSVYGINQSIFKAEAGKANQNLEPSSLAWFGTDANGRDLYSRIIYGAQVSLMIGLFTGVISVAIGTIIGCIAGFKGGRLDDFIMRITDVALALPLLVVLVIVRGMLQNVAWAKSIMGETTSVRFTVILLSIFGWMGVARLVRGQVKQLKEREFVEAARALGASTPRLMFRHLLPNSVGQIMVALTLSVVGAITAYAAKMAQAVGFKAVYLSGGGVAANSLGIPDLGISTMEDVLIDANRITNATDLPLLVDIDTGWGGAFNIARIEAGTPLFHVDYGPDNLPHETGVIATRTSFRKGCYLGQEVVARMESLGKPKQRLVGVGIVDPDRAKAHTKAGTVLKAEDVSTLLAAIAQKYAASQGAGLAILADESSSPTRARLVRHPSPRRFPRRSLAGAPETSVRTTRNSCCASWCGSWCIRSIGCTRMACITSRTTVPHCWSATTSATWTR